jgi:hypothetical protein
MPSEKEDIGLAAVVLGADVDVVRTAFFTTEVVAGALTSSEPPPHPEATRATTSSRPATVLMPQACHRDEIAV